MPNSIANTSIRVPYANLVGDWIGSCTIFDHNGYYHASAASRVCVRPIMMNSEGQFEIDTLGEKIKKIMYTNKTISRPENSSGLLKLHFGHESGKPPEPPHTLFNDVALSICNCEYTLIFDVNRKNVTLNRDPAMYANLVTSGLVKDAKTPQEESIPGANGFMSDNDNYNFIVKNTMKSQILTLNNNHYFPASNIRCVFGTVMDPEGQLILTSSFTYNSYTEPE